MISQNLAVIGCMVFESIEYRQTNTHSFLYTYIGMYIIASCMEVTSRDTNYNGLVVGSYRIFPFQLNIPPLVPDCLGSSDL